MLSAFKRRPISFAWAAAVCLVLSSPAYGLLITHTQVHITKVEFIPLSGGILFDDWIPIAGVGAFSDPGGWSQAYDIDYDMDGEASASANVAGPLLSDPFLNESAEVSANDLTLDVTSDLNYTGSDFVSYASYGFAELYNTFMITATDPIEVQFLLYYTAEMSGESTTYQAFSMDYGIDLVVSDGFTDWTLATDYTLSGANTSLYHFDSGILSGTFTLDPSSYYSIDIAIDPNQGTYDTPEPSTFAMLGICIVAFVALGLLQSRRPPVRMPELRHENYRVFQGE